MRRCLIVQFEPRHEEVIPSLIAACNAAGYRPTVVLNRRIKRLRGDIFELVTGGVADIHYARLSPEPDDQAMDLNEVLTSDTDFVILNTFNRTKAAHWATGCGKPVIAMIHNVDQFMAKSTFYDTLKRPDFGFMTLAPHVTSELISRLSGEYVDKFGQISPCVLSDEAPQYYLSAPRKVVVQGNMSLRSRNYQALIDLLANHPGRWQNLTFEFPSSGADRPTIEAEIEQNGLGARMHLLPVGPLGEVSYTQLFESFRSASLFHPLIPPGFAQYQRIKITSTASMSVGFGVPMVMDRWSETCYRFPALIAENSLEASLDRLSDAPDSEMQKISAELASYREQMTLRSGQDMARIISNIL